MSDEAPVTEGEVKDALEGLTVEQAAPVIAEMTLPELDKVEAAEKAGQDRKGVLEAVAKRRAELETDDSSDAPASESEDTVSDDQAFADATGTFTEAEKQEQAKVGEAATGGAGEATNNQVSQPGDGGPAGMTPEELAEREAVEAAASPEVDTDDDEHATPSTQDVNRESLMERAKSLGIDDLPEDADEEEIQQAIRDYNPELPQAPVDEIKPIIRQGDWVILARGKSVPDHAVNAYAIVDRAHVKHAQGGDDISPMAYEYQDDSDTFLVRLRDSGETLEVTRQDILKHGAHVSDLGFRS